MLVEVTFKGNVALEQIRTLLAAHSERDSGIRIMRAFDLRSVYDQCVKTGREKVKRDMLLDMCGQHKFRVLVRGRTDEEMKAFADAFPDTFVEVVMHDREEEYVA